MNVSSLLQGFGLTRQDPSEPPPSVFAEWNKYASGDVESRGAGLAGQGSEATGSFLGFGGSAGASSASTSHSSAPRYVCLLWRTFVCPEGHV